MVDPAEVHELHEKAERTMLKEPREKWIKYKNIAPGYVYVIHFGHNNWYVGSTKNIERRIREHLSNGYLRSELKGDLCGLIRFKTLQDARIVESAIHHLETKWDSLTLQCIVEASGGLWDGDRSR